MLPEVGDPLKLTLLELSELTSVSVAGIGKFENLRWIEITRTGMVEGIEEVLQLRSLAQLRLAAVRAAL